jgi:hypothetical protein
VLESLIYAGWTQHALRSGRNMPSDFPALATEVVRQNYHIAAAPGDRSAE